MSLTQCVTRLLAMVLVAFLVSTVFDSSAFASDAKCSDYPGLANHIAGCVRDTLDSSTDVYFGPNGVYRLVSQAITAMMIIAVAVFGCLAAFGALEKVGRDAIMLLLKISMVSYFATNTDYMYRQLIDAMDGMSVAVVSFVPMSGPADNTGKEFSQIGCMQKLNPGTTARTAAAGVVGPWLAMDCIIDSVIGIKVEPKTGVVKSSLSDAQEAYNDALSDKDQGFSRGLLYLFFSAYHTSVLGVLLAVVGFIFIWGILNMIVKALFIYIAGYIGVAVMMILAPIFIPLVLFQTTKTYFDKWVKLVISFTLQPVIILAFIVFSIAAVDLAVFSGNYSVMYRIAGDASRQKGFSLNTYLTTPYRSADNPSVGKAVIAKEGIVLAEVKADTKETAAVLETAVGGIAPVNKTVCSDDKTKNDAKLQKICDQQYPIRLWTDALDWKQLASIRSPAVVVSGDAKDIGQQISREVIAAVIFAAIVVFIMNELLKIIPLVAYDLVGDFAQSPNLSSIGGKIPGMDKLKKSLQGGSS